ncbi:MAG TPA: DNA mismatch repair endonuclease MutL [Candidatus Faecimorpha stercoravium]|nr:DNA mismatch repair endonuclease MutL [Candidatus Faecimorpha stercoravium]
MAHIKVLDSQTINKIAAGEVIERPASIVKELVENAIDAGATAITVEIQDGGISRIRVTDNGSGIEAEEVRSAFLRHATSKIETAEDLATVVSLGFRGEALASIAAVSRTEVLTKTHKALTGVRYVTEGGKEVLWEEVAATPGTTFKVEELFFNTPARRKFLKKPAAEAAAVTEFMQKIAMGHPEISFQYIRGSSRVLHTPGDYRLRNCVYAVYGKEILNELLEVDYTGDLKVTGFISRPQLVRVNRSYQHFYLNGRMIRSALLEKILEECYKDLIMPGSFPIAVLRIEVDPALVDVNVHPTKMEVRFSNEGLVREEMYKAISRTLGEVDLMTRVVQAKTVIPEPPQEEKGWAQAFPVFSAEASTASAIEPQEKTPKKEIWRENGYYTGKQEILGTALREPEPIYESGSHPVSAEDTASMTPGEPVAASQQAEEVPGESGNDRTGTASRRFPDPERLRLVGQAFDTYWMAEADGVLYIVDQHAAHERVLYDQIRQTLTKKPLDGQILLEPEPITLSPQEMLGLSEHQELVSYMGFEVEPFGENTVLLRCVPYIFNGPMDPQDFRDMVGLICEGNRNTPRDLLLDKMAMMSCKAAVKGNHTMNAEEARALFRSLARTTNPYNCPHGRPTIVTMTKQQIERLFKRIV